MQKVSTLAGIIIIVVVAVIFFGGVFAYQHFTKSQTPISEKTSDQFDYRNRITGGVNQNLDATFLSGKVFTNFCTSGEWGTFQSDGKIVIEYGTSEGDTPRSPIPSRWEIKNGDLSIYRNSNNQLVEGPKNFKFFNFSGDVFAISDGMGCDPMIIGPDFTKNGQFFDKVIAEEK